MTFILCLGNRDRVLQISDRRHVINGRVASDERNKATIMACPNGRFAVGFTGLARAGSFETQEWILISLYNCGPPDYIAGKIIERMCEKATRDFRSLPSLRGVNRRDKRLSIIFSGYLDRVEPPLCVYAVITNYQDSDTLTDSVECWNEFKTTYYWEKRPDNVALDDISLVQRFGVWPAWRQADELVLRPMLAQRKPTRAIALKAYTVVHDIARRREARNMIGPQLTCIGIPRDRSKDFGYDYDTSVPTNVLPGPDFVAVEPGGDILRGFTVEKDTSAGPHPERPMLVPRVRPDQICPCGSGKRYKACHGVRGDWD
jgi:hypothetical protein